MQQKRETYDRATHTLLWEPGSSAAPLPLLADHSGVTQEEQPLVSLYRIYGPVFRLPQAGQATRIILAGPEISVFMSIPLESV